MRQRQKQRWVHTGVQNVRQTPPHRETDRQRYPEIYTQGVHRTGEARGVNSVTGGDMITQQRWPVEQRSRHSNKQKQSKRETWFGKGRLVIRCRKKLKGKRDCKLIANNKADRIIKKEEKNGDSVRKQKIKQNRDPKEMKKTVRGADATGDPVASCCGPLLRPRGVSLTPKVHPGQHTHHKKASFLHVIRCLPITVPNLDCCLMPTTVTTH